jgi:hypothetical protein
MSSKFKQLRGMLAECEVGDAVYESVYERELLDRKQVAEMSFESVPFVGNALTWRSGRLWRRCK